MANITVQQLIDKLEGLTDEQKTFPAFAHQRIAESVTIDFGVFDVEVRNDNVVIIKGA